MSSLFALLHIVHCQSASVHNNVINDIVSKPTSRLHARYGAHCCVNWMWSFMYLVNPLSILSFIVHCRKLSVHNNVLNNKGSKPTLRLHAFFCAHYCEMAMWSTMYLVNPRSTLLHFVYCHVPSSCMMLYILLWNHNVVNPVASIPTFQPLTHCSFSCVVFAPQCPQ